MPTAQRIDRSYSIQRLDSQPGEYEEIVFNGDVTVSPAGTFSVTFMGETYEWDAIEIDQPDISRDILIHAVSSQYRMELTPSDLI